MHVVNIVGITLRFGPSQPGSPAAGLGASCRSRAFDPRASFPRAPSTLGPTACTYVYVCILYAYVYVYVYTYVSR